MTVARQGGAAFLLVYCALLVLLGGPLLLLEAAVGQLTRWPLLLPVLCYCPVGRSGPVRAMERLCSLAQVLWGAVVFPGLYCAAGRAY